MKLIATMPVRNEAWVLGLSARVALSWCDEIVILNHASTDATVDIIADLQHEHPGRVHLISVAEFQWNEMDHRMMLLDRARQRHATHIAIVDADEVLTGVISRALMQESLHVALMKRGCVEEFDYIVQLPGYNLRGGLTQYHATGLWARRWFDVAFKDDPLLGWHGNRRHHRPPMGKLLSGVQPFQQGQGGVMHLWGASERRLIAKHALYKVADRIQFPEITTPKIDFMYSQSIKGVNDQDCPATWKFADVPESWWTPYAGLMKYLDIGAEPWQEAEVRRLVALHGAERFAGLDLFGVA